MPLKGKGNEQDSDDTSKDSFQDIWSSATTTTNTTTAPTTTSTNENDGPIVHRANSGDGSDVNSHDGRSMENHGVSDSVTNDRSSVVGSRSDMQSNLSMQPLPSEDGRHIEPTELTQAQDDATLDFCCRCGLCTCSALLLIAAIAIAAILVIREVNKRPIEIFQLPQDITIMPTTIVPTRSPTAVSVKPFSQSPTSSSTLNGIFSQSPTLETTSTPSPTSPKLWPSKPPSAKSTLRPTMPPPTQEPSDSSRWTPTTRLPTGTPTTQAPTASPSSAPTRQAPTDLPTDSPTRRAPTDLSTESPSRMPTTKSPTRAPTTKSPTRAPTTKSPTRAPTTKSPTKAPVTRAPTHSPTTNPASPVLPLVDYGGTPDAMHFPLQRCEGDCDKDEDCDEGLYCFQRDSGDVVPGCEGSLLNRTDFCLLAVEASLVLPLRDHGNPPDAIHFPLQRCEGDCDSDAECDEGLHCLQRRADDAVPGCEGSLVDRTDYCVLEARPSGASRNLGTPRAVTHYLRHSKRGP